jgi:hypothetical protein
MAFRGWPPGTHRDEVPLAFAADLVRLHDVGVESRRDARLVHEHAEELVVRQLFAKLF